MLWQCFACCCAWVGHDSCHLDWALVACFLLRYLWRCAIWPALFAVYLYSCHCTPFPGLPAVWVLSSHFIDPSSCCGRLRLINVCVSCGPFMAVSAEISPRDGPQGYSQRTCFRIHLCNCPGRTAWFPWSCLLAPCVHYIAVGSGTVSRRLCHVLTGISGIMWLPSCLCHCALPPCNAKPLRSCAVARLCTASII